MRPYNLYEKDWISTEVTFKKHNLYNDKTENIAK